MSENNKKLFVFLQVIPAKKQNPPKTQVGNNPRRRNKTSPRLFPEMTTVSPASPVIRSMSSEEEGTSSRAGPSTTSVPPNSSMSAVTGRNVGDQSNVTATGSAMDAWTMPRGSPSKVNVILFCSPILLIIVHDLHLSQGS